MIGAGDYQTPAIKRIHQLGYDVYRTLKEKHANINIYAPNQEELDITDLNIVKNYINIFYERGSQRC